MTRRILIIEDTPTIARVQKHIAQKVGYEADIAGSLAEAKQLIAEQAQLLLCRSRFYSA